MTPQPNQLLGFTDMREEGRAGKEPGRGKGPFLAPVVLPGLHSCPRLNRTAHLFLWLFRPRISATLRPEKTRSAGPLQWRKPGPPHRAEKPPDAELRKLKKTPAVGGGGEQRAEKGKCEFPQGLSPGGCHLPLYFALLSCPPQRWPPDASFITLSAPHLKRVIYTHHLHIAPPTYYQSTEV